MDGKAKIQHSHPKRALACRHSVPSALRSLLHSLSACVCSQREQKKKKKTDREREINIPNGKACSRGLVYFVSSVTNVYINI